jgi:hypothetical protein
VPASGAPRDTVEPEKLSTYRPLDRHVIDLTFVLDTTRSCHAASQALGALHESTRDEVQHLAQREFDVCGGSG